LTPKDLKLLNELIVSCNATADLLDRLESCGMPVEAPRADNQEHLAFAERVKAQFFPGQP
jgi:hypothetical protein